MLPGGIFSDSFQDVINYRKAAWNLILSDLMRLFSYSVYVSTVIVEIAAEEIYYESPYPIDHRIKSEHLVNQ